MKKKTLDEALMEFKTKGASLNGWRVTELSAEKAANHMVYVKRMAKEMKEVYGDFKHPVSTIQSPSAARVLAMNEEELEAYRSRPMPSKEEAQVWKDADQAQAELTKAELRQQSRDGLIAEGLRRDPKNQVGDAISEGLSGVTSESKERAIDSFMETKATLTGFQKALVKLNPEALVGIAPEPAPKPTKFTAFISRLMGKTRARQADSDMLFRLRDIAKEFEEKK